MSQTKPDAPNPAQKTPETRALHLRLVDLLGSYGLAVAVLALLFLLTFLGTIEQTQSGLFEVQKKYFESIVVKHDLGGWLPIFLPGAYLLMILLAINLAIGGMVRIKKHKRTWGVIVIHVGIMLLLAAGFVKLRFSDDGQLTLYEDEQAAHYTSYYEWEVAIYDATAEKDVKELLIPHKRFTHLTGNLDQGAKSTRFTSQELPFDLTLSHFVPNCRPYPRGPMWKSKYPFVNGYALKPDEVRKEAELNTAGVYVTVHPKSGQKDIRGILWGFETPYHPSHGKKIRYAQPLVVTVANKSWAIDLRKRRFDMPFTMRLDKFTHELYPGTSIPKVFLSDVTKFESDTESQYKIQMNEPLRHGGLVLFQAAWGPPPEIAKPGDPNFSTFAVVRNPSDHWPIAACVIIALGMLIAFTQKMAGYVRSQTPKRQRGMPEKTLQALGLRGEE